MTYDEDSIMATPIVPLSEYEACEAAAVFHQLNQRGDSYVLTRTIEFVLRMRAREIADRLRFVGADGETYSNRDAILEAVRRHASAAESPETWAIVESLVTAVCEALDIVIKERATHSVRPHGSEER